MLIIIYYVLTCTTYKTTWRIGIEANASFHQKLTVMNRRAIKAYSIEECNKFTVKIESK